MDKSMARNIADSIAQREVVLRRFLADKKLDVQERKRILEMWDASLEKLTGDVLAALDGARAEKTPAKSPAPTKPAATPKTVGRTVDQTGNTVAGAIRVVLAEKSRPLQTHEIIAAVQAMRPGTSGDRVSGALFAMRDRGEIEREGTFKNYKYFLVQSRSVANGVGSSHQERS